MADGGTLIATLVVSPPPRRFVAARHGRGEDDAVGPRRRCTELGHAGVEQHERAVVRLEAVESPRRFGAGEHSALAVIDERDDVGGRWFVDRSERAAALNSIDDGRIAGADPQAARTHRRPAPRCISPRDRKTALPYRLRSRRRGRRVKSRHTFAVPSTAIANTFVSSLSKTVSSFCPGRTRSTRPSPPVPAHSAPSAACARLHTCGVAVRQPVFELRTGGDDAFEADVDAFGGAAKKLCRGGDGPERRTGRVRDDAAHGGNSQDEHPTENASGISGD